MAHSKKDIARILKSSRASAAIERADYFARPGAKAADWKGGRHQVQTDRRKDSSRRACRDWRVQ
jgi:hypothetical protein